MNVRGRKYPYITEWGTPISYDPGVVIMPMHDIWGTPDSGNEENVFFRFGSLDQEKVSASAELPAPLNYGVRTGYVKREMGESFLPDGTGWHNFTVTVLSSAEYILEWDGVLLGHVIEKEPVTMQGDSFEFSIRCDFLDVEIRDAEVVQL